MGMDGAIGEDIAFLEHFRDLPDPRQPGKVVYPLDDVLLLSLLDVLAGAEAGVQTDVIAIDGKTVRRSTDKKGGKAAIHMVSAFAARQRLVLGQVKVAEKSNKIVAIP